VPIRLAAGSTGTDSSDTANAALAIGIVALALAIAALVLAGLALRKRKGASDTVTTDNSTHGWLSVSQAAGALGVPSHAVLRQIQSGELQAMYATTGKRKGLRVRVARRGELVDKPTDEHAQVPTPTTGPSSGANTNAGWLGLDQAVRALGVPREVVLRRIQTGELKATYSTTGKRKGLRVITAGGFVEKPTGEHIAVPARAAGPTAFHGRSGGWLSLDEAVRALGVPREVVLRQIQSGALEAIHSNKGPRKGLRVKVNTPSSSLLGNGT